MTETLAESRVVLFLDHDFNKARGRGGFHEVVLDKIMERNVHSGDVVDIGDEDYKARGRVRCLIAIVEDAPEESRFGPVDLSTVPDDAPVLATHVDVTAWERE